MDNQTRLLVGVTLSFIVFSIIAAGALEVNLISTQYKQLQDAAQVGVLYGSICNCGADEIELRIRNASSYPINLMSPEVTVAVVGGIQNECEVNGLEVHVLYLHLLTTPLASKIVGSKYILLDAFSTSLSVNPNCQ